MHQDLSVGGSGGSGSPGLRWQDPERVPLGFLGSPQGGSQGTGPTDWASPGRCQVVVLDSGAHQQLNEGVFPVT